MIRRTTPNLHRNIAITALTAAAIPLLAAGCAMSGGKAMEAHKKGIEGVFEEDYVVPKKPVDRAYIGAAWSRQFGPVEDPNAPDVRVRKERSLNAVVQEKAYNIGISLGGQSLSGLAGDQRLGSAGAGAGAGGADRARLEGVEIISAVSLADIPFEPNVPYITEALRLANFQIKGERGAQAGIGVAAMTPMGSKGGSIDAAARAEGGTEGEGLVVAYKLHMIDGKSYAKKDSGAIPLDLDRSVDVPQAGLIVKARLQLIDPGAGKSLPRNLLWACARADAVSRDMVAAWLVDIRPTDPRRRSLTIAFPAHPKVDDCGAFSGIIHSRIDPATSKIHRQKAVLTLVESELDDAMRPVRFDARLSIEDEAFNIRPVSQSEAGTGGR